MSTMHKHRLQWSEGIDDALPNVGQNLVSLQKAEMDLRTIVSIYLSYLILSFMFIEIQQQAYRCYGIN